MENIQYKIIETPPTRKLLKISGDRNFISSLDAFEQDTYFKNIEEMQRTYYHPQTLKKISFREPTTAESILVASYDFKPRIKEKILKRRWLQLGRMVRTPEGIFVNPPKDGGATITDEKILKSYLNGVKPIKAGKGKIYIVPNSRNLKDFGFAPYETFKIDNQDNDVFLRGGLARVLEHTTEKKAKNFGIIISPEFNKKGITVPGRFDSVNRQVSPETLRIACFSYNRGSSLTVDCAPCFTNFGGYYGGSLFGILK
jgi:hypothetical protein